MENNVIATACRMVVQHAMATSFLPVNAEHRDGGIVALIAEIISAAETGEVLRVEVKAEAEIIRTSANQAE